VPASTGSRPTSFSTRLISDSTRSVMEDCYITAAVKRFATHDGRPDKHYARTAHRAPLTVNEVMS
jgi:hypothetical protein